MRTRDRDYVSIAIKAGACIIGVGLWLLLVLRTHGQEPVIVKFPAGARLVVIDSGVKGEALWRLDARLRDPGSHYKDLAHKRLVVGRPDAGTYELTVFDKTAGDVKEWLLVVEGGPVPPTPPSPIPPPVPPPDTLATKIAAAYAMDVAAGKGGETERKTMQAAFREFGALIPVGKTIVGKEVVEAVAGLVIQGKLPRTLDVIHTHLGTRVPEYTVRATISVDMKARYVSAFAEIAEALNIGPMPPPPGPTPVPMAGLKVLIVEEGSKRTPAFVAVISSPMVRDYLDAKATKQGWRVQDQNLSADKDLPWVKELLARPRASVPWIVVAGDGRIAFEGPLPIVSPVETLAFLKKFGG